MHKELISAQLTGGHVWKKTAEINGDSDKLSISKSIFDLDKDFPSSALVGGGTHVFVLSLMFKGRNSKWWSSYLKMACLRFSPSIWKALGDVSTVAKSTFQSHAINTRDYEEEYARFASTQPEETRAFAETAFPRREQMKARAIIDNTVIK